MALGSITVHARSSFETSICCMHFFKSYHHRGFPSIRQYFPCACVESQHLHPKLQPRVLYFAKEQQKIVKTHDYMIVITVRNNFFFDAETFYFLWEGTSWITLCILCRKIKNSFKKIFIFFLNLHTKVTFHTFHVASPLFSMHQNFQHKGTSFSTH